jgi:hypothetical protein
MSVINYGDPLGSNRGVIAYANKGAKRFKIDYFFAQGVCTGLRYQCVEYARRWMVEVKGLTFSDVLVAADIWSLNFVRSISGNEQKQLKQRPNGCDIAPVVGDLLIYARAKHLPWGHVAVIVGLELSAGKLRIAEQNEQDHFWAGDFSRELNVRTEGRNFVIEDKYPVIGWMSYAS